MFTRESVENQQFMNIVQPAVWLASNASYIESEMLSKTCTTSRDIDVGKGTEDFVAKELRKIGFTACPTPGSGKITIRRICYKPIEPEESQYFSKEFSALSMWLAARRQYATLKSELALECQQEMGQEFFAKNGMALIAPKTGKHALFLRDVVDMIKADGSYHASVDRNDNIMILDPQNPNISGADRFKYGLRN